MTPSTVSLIGRFIRRVLAPPARTAAPHAIGASVLSSRVFYRLFIIKSHASTFNGHDDQVSQAANGSEGHTAYNPTDTDTALNISNIRHILQQAALPGQEIFLSVQR